MKYIKTFEEFIEPFLKMEREKIKRQRELRKKKLEELWIKTNTTKY